MLLKSITLEDFRQFKGRQSITFCEDFEKNVTVILGSNGTGKTTLEQAFRWCLYGKTDFSDPYVLCKSTLNDMQLNSDKKVIVEIQLTHKGMDYIIMREQIYTKDSSGQLKRPNNSKLTISYKNSDGQREYVPELQKEFKIKEILPEELSGYFFFDGERIEKMSKEITTGRSSEFARAVKSLLGLDSYDAAIKHLNVGSNSVIGQYNKQYNSDSDSRIGQYSADIEKYDKLIEQKSGRQEELERKIPVIEQEIEHITLDIEKNRESEELSQQKNKYVEQKRKADNFLSQSSTDIVDSFHKHYRNYFVKKLAADAVAFLASTEKIDKGIPHIHQKTIEFLVKRGTCICGAPISAGNEAFEHLNDILKYIPPRSIGTEISYYVKDCESKIQNGVNLYEEISSKLEMRRNQEEIAASCAENIERIEEKLLGMQNVGQLQSKLMTYRKELRDARQEHDDLIDAISSIKTKRERCETERRELSLQNEQNKKIEIYKAYAEYIVNVLKADYAEQETKIRKSLEKGINEIFGTIYEGGLSLSIDEKYNVSTIVNDFAENNIGVETSTAQSISIIFAFIAGVIKTARENSEKNQLLATEAYPLVMDAPLSAFDKARIKTVCETLPKIAEQVIIFIKDTDGEIAEKHLTERIGRRYSLDKKNEFETYIVDGGDLYV